MDEKKLLILFMLSSIMGFCGNLLGIGGSSLLVVVLIVFLNFSVQKAIPIALICSFATAISATISAKPKKEIYKYPLGMTPIAIVSSFYFSTLSYKFDENLLLWLLFTIIFAFSILMVFAQKEKIIWFNNSGQVLFNILGAFFMGASTGVFGIGGGIILVPLLTLFSPLKIKDATQVSLFIMIFTSAAALVAHSYFTKIDFQLGTTAALGAVSASLIASVLKPKINEKILKLLYMIVSTVMLLGVAYRSRIF